MHNRTWKSLNYWPLRRALFWGSAYPLWFVAAVALSTFGVAYMVGLPHFSWAALVGASEIDAKYDLAPFVGVPWSIQATVVSLVYPIVLSYIALLLQRRARSAARQHVYQVDSAVVPAGISSLVLLLVMSAEYFLVPFLTPEKRTTYLTMLLLGNWGWLAFNLALTGYFVSRTVRFIQDRAQENSFTRVAVVVGLRDELRLAMQQHLLVNAPDVEWGLKDLVDTEDGLPRVLMFKLGDGKPAVTQRLTGKYVLHEVHLRLLAMVARRWSRRAASVTTKQRPRMCFPAIVGEVSPEEAVLCTIEGGPPLTWLEEALVKVAFVYRRERPESFTLSTRKMLEELYFEVQSAADARQFDSARDALRRMFRLHETLLLASRSSDEGVVRSISTMSPSPYAWGNSSFGIEWLLAYRELATTAAGLIGDDQRLFRGLASVPARIANVLPPVPEQPILEGMEAVGSPLAHELGAWWTRRADESLAASTTPFSGMLPPPLSKAYEHALTSFVGAWGELRVDPLEVGSEEEVWDSYRARALVYARHIDLGAKFFLKAVARGDVVGADWLLESFLKWWGTRQHEMDVDVPDEFQVRHVTLSISSKTWEEAREFLRVDENQPSLDLAEKAMNLGLKRYWENMRLYLATLLVHYAGDKPPPNSREMKLAAVLLSGKPQRRGGSVVCDDLCSMDRLMTAALSLLHGVESPGNRINSFAESLRWDSEAPEVSGWIYGWSGSPTSFYSMKPALVTLLLALPAPRAAKATAARTLVESWWKDLDKLSAVTRDIVELRKIALSGGFDGWAVAVNVLQTELGHSTRIRTSRRALAGLLSNLRRTATFERLMTIRSCPVDEAKVKRFAASLSSLAFGPEFWPTPKGMALRFVPGLGGPIERFNIEDFKTRFLTGIPDERDGGASKQMADTIRECAIAWPLQRRLLVEGIAPVNSTILRGDYKATVGAAQALLLAIASRCAALLAQGEAPVVLVGRGAIASYLQHYKWGDGSWQYPVPEGVTVEGRAEDGRLHRLCAVNGHPVYQFDTPNGDCYVVPASFVATLEVSGASPDSVLKVRWEQVNDERISIKLTWVGRLA